MREKETNLNNKKLENEKKKIFLVGDHDMQLC